MIIDFLFKALRKTQNVHDSLVNSRLLVEFLNIFDIIIILLRTWWICVVEKIVSSQKSRAFYDVLLREIHLRHTSNETASA